MKEIVITSHIEAQISEHKKTITLTTIAIVILSFASFIFLATSAYLITIGGIATIIYLSTVVSKNRSKINSYKVGLAGENILRNTLKVALPDSYTAYFGFPLKSTDIDCLLIGPAGVFVLEAKSHKGDIVYDENGWRQSKVVEEGIYIMEI